MGETIDMKKIILFYEHKVRELGSYNQLKSILENDYGYNVYILSIVFEWTKGVILANLSMNIHI